MPATASSAASTLARRRDLIFQEAGARRARLTLTHWGERGWRLHTGSFAEPRNDPSLIPVVLAGVEPAELATLRTGAEVGLTFRRGHKKCVCYTVVERRQTSDAGVFLELRCPQQIQELQRRVFERTPPPADRSIQVEFWENQGGDEKATARRANSGQLVDISVGGMRIKTTLSEPVTADRTYRCRLGIPAARASLTLDAVLRHVEAPVDGVSSLGLQFIGLEASREGYERMLELARFVKYLQRQTARRPG